MAVAEAWYGAVDVFGSEIEIAWFWAVAVLALDVRFASARAVSRVANRRRVEGADCATVAHFAAYDAELVVVGRATVALFANDAWSAFAFACRVALGAFGAEMVALAVCAFVLVFAPVKAYFALFAVWSGCVAFALVAVAAMACCIV